MYGLAPAPPRYHIVPIACVNRLADIIGTLPCGCIGDRCRNASHTKFCSDVSREVIGMDLPRLQPSSARKQHLLHCAATRRLASAIENIENVVFRPMHVGGREGTEL